MNTYIVFNHLNNNMYINIMLAIDNGSRIDNILLIAASGLDAAPARTPYTVTLY